uniref:Uncharacterized protein n=1 Tax=Ditylenchus dipsaci TaxID=166011 RepID=A0A915EQ44_9BILA
MEPRGKRKWINKLFGLPKMNIHSIWANKVKSVVYHGKWLGKTHQQSKTQKKLVLVVVSIALLLDNMLYMVIVPIIPKYLRDIHAYEVEYVGYHNETTRLKNGTIVVTMTGGSFDYLDEEIELGWLFASKALVGYELPMINRLIVMFSSTAIFALGKSYGVLFFARSLQVSQQFLLKN